MSSKAKPARNESFGDWPIPLGLFACLVIFYGVAATFFPVVQDDAYYYSWGKRLSLGYFDHPPGVAWLSALSTPFDTRALNGRFGAILISSLGLWSFFSLCRKCRFPNRQLFLAACILGAGNAAALICGFLTTPDAIIMFAWTLALHEAAAALLGSPKRWLSAGVFVGIGLLGKYTMLLIGPVFLTTLWIGARQQLLTKWPYLGGLLALLVFSPNLIWNQQNHWITWKFQLRHGLALEHSELVVGELPAAKKPDEGSSELALARLFSPPETEMPIEPFFDQEWGESQEFGGFNRALGFLKELTNAQSLPKRLSEFLLGQLALWGALLIVLLARGWAGGGGGA